MSEILHHLNCVQPNKLWEVSTTITLWRMSTIDIIRQYDFVWLCWHGMLQTKHLAASCSGEIAQAFQDVFRWRSAKQLFLSVLYIYIYLDMLIVLKYTFFYIQFIRPFPLLQRFPGWPNHAIAKATRAAMEERQRRWQAGQQIDETNRRFETRRPLQTVLFLYLFLYYAKP